MRKFIGAIAALAFITQANAQSISPPPNPAGSGTVTSVGVGAIAGVTTSGAPVTTSGSISQTLNSQTANTVFAAPNGSAGAPSFRGLVTADVPTGTSGSVIPLLSGANTYSATQTLNNGAWINSGLNLAYTNTYAPNVRAPLFIWQNPTGTVAAGTSVGQQIWIGNNPTAAPGANNIVASTIAVTNGNNRSTLWAQNMLAGLCGTAEGCSTADYINSPVVGSEIDVYGSATWTPANRAFNPSGGTYVIEGQQLYCQGPQYCTTGLSVWSTLATGANWWKEGISMNRIADIGIHFDKTAGDTGTPLSVAAIQDDSNSANVLQIGSGTHTNYVNSPNWVITNAGNARFGNQGEAIGVTNYLVVGGTSGTTGFELNKGGTVGLYCTTDGSTYGQCLTGGNFALQLGVNNSAKAYIDTSGNFGVGTSTNLSTLTSAGSFATKNPVTNTAATYTVLATDYSIIFNTTNNTLTLPAAASFPGRILWLKTVAAVSVTSASSNVIPLAGGAASTAILPATAGKFAMLQSDGANWNIMAAN